MQEERLDGSYLITQNATEEQIISAINDDLNRSVQVANSINDLSSIKELQGKLDSWDNAPEQFQIKKVKGKWKKFKK